MKKTIKYLENGEYHYATVKDVGDIAKLKTDSKDDLVAAINELFITGGEGPKKPDGYDNLVNNVADAIQKQQQMSSTITNMQQTAQLSDAEMAHMKQVQEELRQEYLKAVKELNEAVEKAKADAAALDKKTNDMQDKIDETFADVNKEVSDVHKQLDAEAKGLHKDLDETKTNLEATRKDLLNSTQEYGQVHSEVKELQDKFSRRVWSTDLDPVREQVSKNSTEVQQTKDKLERKADQSNLDLVTNSVENLSAKVKQNASGLEVAVKRDELGGDVARLLGDKTNLLLGTRSFSGEDNWKNLDTVTIEPEYYKGLKSAAVQVLDGSIYQPYRVKANTAYTFSFFAREDKDNPKAKLAIKPIDAKNINIDNEEQVVHITTEWQRFAVTFSVDKECDVSIQVIQGPEASNNVLHLAGLKLQYGQNNTPWEPNEADVAENIEHTESQFNVYSDQIAGIVKKQEKMGDKERQLDTRITETAKGLEQTSKDIQVADGKINEFNGKLESTAQGLKTEYEKYTNEAIGQISDSSLNLIHNSAFSNQDNQFESWQNISAKATVREDSNSLHWVELTQSGQGTDNPIGVTSNYFIVKQGKVTVAVDVKLGDKANLDNQNILLLELYDESKKRVDFTDVSVSQLGLSMSVLNDHNVHRGLYRLGIDRKDVKYMTVKAILHRNGDLWFTNFSARLSSIDDGGYTPNPDDLNKQILKMNTKIEEDAEHIALKANSVDVTRDIKSAVNGIQVGGVNLIPNSGTDIVIESKTTDVYPQWDNHLLYSSLQSNTTYTFSVSATNTNGVEQASVRIFKEFLDGKFINKEAAHWYFNADGKRYNFTFTTPNDAIPYDILLYAGPMGTLQGKNFVTTYHHPQLELGNKSTSWSPAPEDTSAEIKSAKDAAIQVASDQINLHVNELSTSFDDRLNKRVNEQKTAYEKITSDRIEQTVKKITDVQNNVNNLNEKVDSNNGGGINLLTNSAGVFKPTAERIDNYVEYNESTVDLVQGQEYTISGETNGQWSDNHQPAIESDRCVLWFVGGSPRFSQIVSDTKTGTGTTFTWNHPSGNYYLRINVYHPSSKNNIYAKNIKLEKGTVATPWSPNPEDIAKKIDTQTLDSANIDQMKTQGHYFVHNLTGNPISGWVYVDVFGNGIDRIRQDVYQDSGTKHMYRRLFGSSWSDWEQGAYISDVNNLKTETTAKITNLGDRVTTEVDSVTTKINDSHTNDVELIRNNNFPDGNKGSWNGNLTTVIDGNSIPAELGQNGMKVLRVIQRDTYEDDIWYSVKPGEIFDVDYWIWPTGLYDSQLGLWFVDKDKGNSTWRGVVAKKGTGWTHYTGTIEAPSNAAFAKPWIQVDKDASETGSAAWIGKPSIRRHDTFAEKKISEINTKLEVANGKIEGKVTETQVNDILNGKGYATQSWAESNFRMKSDSIELEVKKITDPISDKINGVNNRLNSFQVGGRNYLRNSDKSITGWGQDLGTIPNEVLNELAGKTITVSCDVEWSGYAHDNSRQNRLGFEASVTGSDGHNYWFGAWVHPSTDSGKERVSAQYTLPAGVTFAVNNNGHNGYVDINGSGKVSHAKIEIGNRMTDWTPAPEDINQKIETQTLDSANIDEMKTQGHYFVRNLTGNPVGGWVYVDVTGNNNDRIRQDVYADQSYVHKFRSWNGSRWTDWEEEVKNTDIISKINISPENIKLSSSKIEIDGNTYIHGDLQTKNVRLVGKKGVMDLSGDSGLVLQNNNGSIISLGESGLDLKYKNDFEINIDSQVMTLSRRNGVLGQEMPIAFGNIGSVMLNKDTKSNGFMLRYNPGSPTDPKLAGASFMAFGYNTTTPGEIQSQMIMYAKDTQITGTRVQRKGIHFLDAIEFDGNLPIRFPSAHDNLYIHSRKWDSSQQAGYYQPSISLQSNDGNYGNAGVTFQWDAIKPFGAVDMTNASIWMQDAEKELRFNWIANDSVFGGAKLPALYRPNDDGSIASGIAFAPGSTWDFSSGVHNITAGMLRLGV